MSLRLRLALGLAAVVTAALSVLAFGVVRSTRDHLTAEVRHLVERSLDNRVNFAPRPPADGRERPADPRVLETAHLAIDRDGSIIVAEPAGPPTAARSLPALTPQDVAQLRTGRALTVDSIDRSLRYLAVGRTTDTDVLEIEAAPLVIVDSTVSSLERWLAVGGIITLLMAVTAAVIAVRHGLKPLDDVISAADAIAAGERQQRIPTDEGPTEIRHLSSALDRMLEQQRSAQVNAESNEARLRRFVADASHELQTPITSVLGWTELLRKGAFADSDPAASNHAMARIEGESRRMAALVDDLLTLARLDEEQPLSMQTVDLTAIAYDAVADARAIDPDRPITLDADQSTNILGHAPHLRQVFDNLLRNVRTHTPSGTPARVVVRSGPSAHRVTVEDEGPGIAPDDLGRIFDRFWRQDTARTRTSGGTGLGLAIVAAIVASHRGTITAGGGDSGAVFVVELPASDVRAT